MAAAAAAAAACCHRSGHCVLSCDFKVIVPAVLDIVSRVEHALLERLGAEAGGCIPVSAEEMGRLLALPEVAAHMMRRGGRHSGQCVQ